MKGLLILAASALLCAHATASELRSMLSVKSVAELEAKSHEASTRKLTEETCAAELASRLLPRACFRQVAGATSRSSQRLARICVENAKASRSRLDLSGPLDDLPSDCRKAAVQRIEDLEYIDASLSPETSVMRTLGPELEESSRD